MSLFDQFWSAYNWNTSTFPLPATWRTLSNLNQQVVLSAGYQEPSVPHDIIIFAAVKHIIWECLNLLHHPPQVHK